MLVWQFDCLNSHLEEGVDFVIDVITQDVSFLFCSAHTMCAWKKQHWMACFVFQHHGRVLPFHQSQSLQFLGSKSRLGLLGSLTLTNPSPPKSNVGLFGPGSGQKKPAQMQKSQELTSRSQFLNFRGPQRSSSDCAEPKKVDFPKSRFPISWFQSQFLQSEQSEQS